MVQESQHQAKNKVQIKQQKDGWWFWRKLDDKNDIVAVDRGKWGLERAIWAAHEANPEVDRVIVIMPEQDPDLMASS